MSRESGLMSILAIRLLVLQKDLFLQQKKNHQTSIFTKEIFKKELKN